MRFYFAVIGKADAQKEVFLVEWLQDMISEYNSRSGSPVDSYHVLVKEEDTQK